MSHIFSPVYQPRHYGCLHVIHTFTKNNPYKERQVQKLCLVQLPAIDTLEDETQRYVYWVSNTLAELYQIDRQGWINKENCGQVSSKKK